MKNSYWKFEPPTPAGWILFFGLVGGMAYGVLSLFWC